MLSSADALKVGSYARVNLDRKGTAESVRLGGAVTSYTGSVTGATCVGGIAGKHTGGTDPTVTNCYNTGSVKGASCGALVGEYAAEIRNSYYLEGSASAATDNTKDGQDCRGDEGDCLCPCTRQ